ncbi:MAG: bifunctional 4-hydroxy-2-oxoglutarate aldolase/2-dehydro-3-deoxy-phosphogluconate aldolase [Nitrospinaceae bacterium]|jgi:2-dehydro-3-deoxyphosphogluconate aldolase/(4S)-4-hydroxy-2-oxoglutarate aldolase|nr:MAG: bifunctional 4-hydroxy-2-oxoglutarate aldolase/2-dehydro-3-deoxy-phosphogluconate aldolase [Nitrospinaceae bacterium]
MAGAGFDLSRFLTRPVLGIVRGADEACLAGVLDALVEGGLTHIEITLNTANALGLLSQAAKRLSAGVCLGAGTVRNRADAARALDAGARFIVAPTLDGDVAGFCRERSVAYFPGALTPTEIERAWDAGAALVKVFPASQMGPGYLSTVKGPLDEVRLMAVGGVNRENVAEYLAAGASAVAIGGSIVSDKRMKNKEFKAIREDVQGFLLAVKKFYSKINA